MHITVYRSEHRQDPQYDMTIFGCGPTTCRIVVEPKWEGTNKKGIKLVDLLEIFHRIIESPWVGVYNGSGTSMKTLLESESIVGARLIVDNSSYRKLEIVKQVMLGRYMAEKDYTLMKTVFESADISAEINIRFAHSIRLIETSSTYPTISAICSCV